MAVPRTDDQYPIPARMAARLRAGIARKRSVMRIVILAERIWPLLVPILCVVALYVSLSWFGYFHAAPLWLRLATLVLLIGGLGWSLYGLRTFRWPGKDAVDRRLERINHIEHQALAVQDDRLENDAQFSRALWIEHQRRMAERIAALRTGLPEPDTPRRDPYGLRALVVLILVTAFAYSYSNRAGFLSDALSFSTPEAPAAPVRIDAWITPPAYTGRAPIFLTRADGDVPGSLPLPAGSEVTVRISGGRSPHVTYQGSKNASPKAIAPADAGTSGRDTGSTTAAGHSYRFKPASDGRLAILEGTERKAWNFTIIPDKAPTITFAGEPKSTVNGSLELSYRISDDYGVEKARAVIVPADPPAEGAHPLYGPPDFPLTLPGGGVKSGKVVTNRDLTDHPLAGQRVKITLVAEDGAGQKGHSKTIVTRLPARYFSNPLARAVAEQRRTFALDTNKLPRALDLADALMTAPEETIKNPTHYLLLRTARERMALARNDDMLRDAADYLWQIALGLENGDLSLAQQRLRDAQRALSEALKNNAPDAEIQRLMKELRQAMNDFLKEMAKQAMKNPEQMSRLPNNMQNVLRQQDLERMMNQIENLARSGQRQQAEQLLSQLQQMMNNLQAGRMQRGQRSNGPMRQQMDKLGELLHQQQQLMNQTYQLNQQLQNQLQQDGQQRPGQQDKQGPQGENGRQMTAEQLRQALRELQRQQKNLRNQLGQLQQELKGLGIKPGKGFAEADKAMGNAGEALGKSQGERAVGEQGRALQALRQGAQSMMNQMMQAMGQREGQGQGQRGREQLGRNDRDPLGRPRSTSGPDFGNQVKVPDEIDIQRAREILNQIRKRLGDALSPALEKRYLERLLDMK